MYKIISYLYECPVKPYKKMAMALEKSVRACGYDFKLYSATHDDVGTCLLEGKLYVKCQKKPAFIRAALDDNKEDLVWMDLDCIMQKELGDPLADCDIAFTLRRIKDRYSDKMEIFKFINCGVAFFKNNEATRKFLDFWQGKIKGEECDQAVLNGLLLDYSKLERYGEIIEIGGTKIKMLPCEEYNFFYFPEDHSKARVLHYKGFSFRKEKVYEHTQTA